MGTKKWTTNERIEQLRIGSNMQRFQYCLASDRKLLYLRAIQGHSAKQKVDQETGSPNQDREVTESSDEKASGQTR